MVTSRRVSALLGPYATETKAHAVHLAPDDRGVAVVSNKAISLFQLKEQRLIQHRYPMQATTTRGQAVSWAGTGQWLAYLDELSRPVLLNWDTGTTFDTGR